MNTVALVNVTPIMPIGVQTGRLAYPALSSLEKELRKLTRALHLVDARAVAQELGAPQVQNMVMVGALFGSGFIELRFDLLKKVTGSVIPEKHLDINLLACQRGQDLLASRTGG
jgi:Pyruvate/2-oxoacid:ferredoxin oxidoreductase gamma subunit